LVNLLPIKRPAGYQDTGISKMNLRDVLDKLIRRSVAG
jgi:hypothetical protein